MSISKGSNALALAKVKSVKSKKNGCHTLYVFQMSCLSPKVRAGNAGLHAGTS